jgi:hypothetical protein
VVEGVEDLVAEEEEVVVAEDLHLEIGLSAQQTPSA